MNFNNIKYEINNMKKLNKKSVLVSFIALIIVFLIFLGAKDSDPQTNHINSFISIIIMLTCYYELIYATAKSCRYVVSDYVNDNKIRLYLMPNGRGKFLLNKVIAFVGSFATSSTIGITIGTFLILILSKFINFGFSDNNINYLRILVTLVGYLIYLSSVMIFATYVGVRYQSKVSAIIVSIIFLFLFGNAMISTSTSNQVAFIIIVLVLLFISLLLLLHCVRYINKDEVSR
ncbi:hypothetical protein [Apilactobacillus quenuiae]|uniref:hypothetical protein n=1 Tax=Apilactobacillus quenuiae TaxID=2008377 RepID=UPI000D01F205|nr:hypothetical protein [Apilactobacillus quenuiae]